MFCVMNCNNRCSCISGYIIFIIGYISRSSSLQSRTVFRFLVIIQIQKKCNVKCNATITQVTLTLGLGKGWQPWHHKLIQLGNSKEAWVSYVYK